MDPISVSKIENLQIRIYTLGYFPMGESILVVVSEEGTDKTYISILIDFFEQKGVNQIKQFLEKYKLKNKLDFIVWTHPDYDHSTGLKAIVKDYLSDETIFLLPEGFSLSFFSSLGKRLFSSWVALKKNQWSKSKKNIERVSSSCRRTTPLIYGQSKFTDGYSEPLDFHIEILTPFTDDVFQKTEINKTKKGNNISMSLMIHFGNVAFYFGGDSENEAIERIQINKFENVVFIKIPHHASRTSSILPEMLIKTKSKRITECDSAVSTSLKKGKTKLPDKDILNKYSSVSKHILITENEQHQHGYGIWENIYNIHPYKACTPICHKDAEVWK